MKTRIIMFLMALMFALPAIGQAEIYHIEADGEYLMGYGESRETAKTKAIEDAKRYAVEQAGTYVESYSATRNMQLTEDEVRIIAAGIVRMEREPDISFSVAGDDWRCHAHIYVLVDDSNIDLEKILESRTKVKYVEVEKVVRVPEIHEVYVEKHSYPTDEDGLPMKPVNAQMITKGSSTWLFDYAQCLNAEQKRNITRMFIWFNNRCPGMVTLLTVDDTHGRSFNTFAELTIRKWEATNTFAYKTTFMVFDTSSGQMYVKSGDQSCYVDPERVDEVRQYIMNPYMSKHEPGNAVYYSAAEIIRDAAGRWGDYVMDGALNKGR